MINIGVRHCYFKKHGSTNGINIPIIDISVKEKIVQLSGLNQNRRILAGYDVSLSTPEVFLNIDNSIGDLYWASDEYINESNKRIICFKINDITFLPPDLQYQSKTESVSIITYSINGTSNATNPISTKLAATEQEAKQINSKGW